MSAAAKRDDAAKKEEDKNMEVEPLLDSLPAPAPPKLRLVRATRTLHSKRDLIPLRRLSPLLRYVLATAAPRPDDRPPLLPDFAPPRCCHNLWQCWNEVRWMVGDRTNRVLFCAKHGDAFMESVDVVDFKIDRL